jgi:hypothetical protein
VYTKKGLQQLDKDYLRLTEVVVTVGKMWNTIEVRKWSECCMHNWKHVQNHNCGKFTPFDGNIINVKPTKNGEAVISSQWGVADGDEHLPVFRMPGWVLVS